MKVLSKLSFAIFIIIAIILFIPSCWGLSGDWQTNPENWWDENYVKRRNVTITERSGFALTDYPVNVSFDTATEIAEGICNQIVEI